MLDIGCGCGVIALIAAQRSQATVTGIDIDEASTAQAAENARLSPFADRLHFVTADVRTFAPARSFDCILSNPPDSILESLLRKYTYRAGDLIGDVYGWNFPNRPKASKPDPQS